MASKAHRDSQGVIEVATLSEEAMPTALCSGPVEPMAPAAVASSDHGAVLQRRRVTGERQAWAEADEGKSSLASALSSPLYVSRCTTRRLHLRCLRQLQNSTAADIHANMQQNKISGIT
jgi:hypothetical protein